MAGDGLARLRDAREEGGRRFLGAHDLARAAPDGVLQGPSEHPLGGRVEVRQAPVGVQREEALVGGLHDGALAAHAVHGLGGERVREVGVLLGAGDGERRDHVLVGEGADGGGTVGRLPHPLIRTLVTHVTHAGRRDTA